MLSSSSLLFPIDSPLVFDLRVCKQRYGVNMPRLACLHFRRSYTQTGVLTSVYLRAAADTAGCSDCFYCVGSLTSSRWETRRTKYRISDIKRIRHWAESNKYAEIRAPSDTQTHRTPLRSYRGRRSPYYRNMSMTVTRSRQRAARTNLSLITFCSYRRLPLLLMPLKCFHHSHLRSPSANNKEENGFDSYRRCRHRR